MAYMEWSDKFETGLQDIDNDHQALFMFVNDLDDKVAEGEGDEAIGSTLAGLLRYIEVHFAREEGFMLAVDYPELDHHREQHGKLTEEVIVLKAQFDADPVQLDPDDLLAFLKDWLENHILHSDLKFVPYAVRFRDNLQNPA